MTAMTAMTPTPATRKLSEAARALAAEAENIGINAEGTLLALQARSERGEVVGGLPLAWTQGVRDGWALAIAVLRTEGANMACPDGAECMHTTEWACAEALLLTKAPYRTWPAALN